MLAVIQKACGRKIKWEKRINVFSAELCASFRTRFLGSQLNQPCASWQRVGFDWSRGAGKSSSIFPAPQQWGEGSPLRARQVLWASLVGNALNKACRSWFCEIYFAGSFQFWVLWIIHFLGPGWIWWLVPCLVIKGQVRTRGASGTGALHVHLFSRAFLPPLDPSFYTLL